MSSYERYSLRVLSVVMFGVFGNLAMIEYYPLKGMEVICPIMFLLSMCFTLIMTMYFTADIEAPKREQIVDTSITISLLLILLVVSTIIRETFYVPPPAINNTTCSCNCCNK